jgi:hypothetical protein
MRKSCLLAPAVSLLLVAGPITAAEPITPPPMYPPNSWEGRSAAVVRVLDKLDAHAETLTIPTGQAGSYKSLGISVRSCLQHPPGLAPDSAAFLSVRDAHAEVKPFVAWMFSAEPFTAVFESPVYGVQLVSCGGADAAPAAPPLMPPPPPGAAATPDPVYPSGVPDPSTPADGPVPPPPPD